jgi:hypothetical protein
LPKRLNARALPQSPTPVLLQNDCNVRVLRHHQKRSQGALAKRVKRLNARALPNDQNARALSAKTNARALQNDCKRQGIAAND